MHDWLYNKKMTRKDDHIPLYAVVRVDYYDMPTTFDYQDLDNPGIQFDKYTVTVKEIVTTPEEAIKEVSRLNELNAHLGYRYYWEMTRYFPDGGSFGTEVKR